MGNIPILMDGEQEHCYRVDLLFDAMQNFNRGVLGLLISEQLARTEKAGCYGRNV